MLPLEKKCVEMSEVAINRPVNKYVASLISLVCKLLKHLSGNLEIKVRFPAEPRFY